MINKMKQKPYILLSSCLLDLHTQWDEDCKRYEELIDLVKEGKAVFFVQSKEEDYLRQEYLLRLRKVKHL